MNITVYSTKTCPYCVMLKRWLDDKGTDYTNHFVDEDDAAARKMMSLSGRMGVPFTTIEFDDGTSANILGFDARQFEHALSTKKLNAQKENSNGFC